LRAWWKQRGFDPHATLLASFHAPNRFRAIVGVERMRIDRAGGRLTLVAFRFASDEESDFLMFAQSVQSRIRATDHAGLLDELCVGVVLWNTDQAGAEQFVDSVIAAVQPRVAPRVEIYVYPNAMPANPPPVRRFDGLQEWSIFEEVALVAQMLDSRKAGCEDASCPERAVETEEQQAELESAQPTEVTSLADLFVQPLPIWKRAIDVVGAGIGLVILLPLLAMTALAIKGTSRGPVFFAQRRTGLGGRPFTIYKFRTMCVDAESRKAELRQFSEQDGPAFKMQSDPRVTPIGRYLRKTCIDELPQLWNVLVGDMTLVGPRPLPCDEQLGCAVWQSRRLDVTPGLTCIWQVHGKSRVSFTDWMRMDIRYIRARTFFQDLRLMLETLWAVVLHRASY